MPLYIYIYIHMRSFNCPIDNLFSNEFLHLQGILADFCPNQHWPHNTLLICWELLHDQISLNRSVLGKNFSVLTAQRETQHSQLSSTCLQQLFYAWTFSPPPPSLHCNLKREVKLLIIQLSQTDLSKRRRVFVLNLLLVSGYYEIFGT